MSQSVEAIVEQWRCARPDVDPSPIDAVARLMRLAQYWGAEMRRFMAGYDLQTGEFDVLCSLRRTAAPHELTATEFVRTALVTSGAITNRIDRMERKGLVERVRGTEDRRVVRIRLTAKGMQVVEEVYPKHVANQATFLERLSETERKLLVGHLSALLESFEERSPN
ncbi:DNA-binding transcriptional regulator, MarR family [Glycomyces sambucus]|uniref:DNA-binding transcriptional regulator, MarR family n=1 Tax=Glycomyces sambucus TaxID=380244 RepID=A0A1G9FPL9_9ACTN|nr:MarR family transcriptional regulator [Glycomyces sambucus]SDK90292.1 DNA-binding transcriptional regulator, MarR family [Glycomyces sambucus]